MAYAYAQVNDTGGFGGSGTGANGGAGASAKLDNAASGSSQGGTLNLLEDASGGNGGTSVTGTGGLGGSGTAIIDDDDLTGAHGQSAAIQASTNAIGGFGGNGAIVGKGGDASASTTLTGATTAYVAGYASAAGGDAGEETVASVGVGTTGASGAASVDVLSGDLVYATVSSSGGVGATADGAGATGGTGGSAKASAEGFGVALANIQVSASAGAGGNGVNGANGGAGAAENLQNAVSGSSEDGQLTLVQNANGGGGGASGAAGGAGGAATSDLTTNDLLNAQANQSATIGAFVTSQGGRGAANASGVGGGTGGSANATLTVTGNSGSTVTGSAASYGGASIGGAGGAANADVTATGGTVHIGAYAIAGEGYQGSDQASATGIGNGAAGYVNTQANSYDQASTAVVTAIAAEGSAIVSGSGTAAAISVYGGGLPGFQASDGSVAYGVAAPSSAASNAVLNANPDIQTAFGPNPGIYALGELGGGHATSGTDTETTSSSVTISINQANLGLPGNLIIGLYGGQANDTAGITGITLTVTGNGVQLAQEVLSPATAFQDDPISLGALANSGILTVDVSLSVTSDEAGAGFYGDFILGDPPSGAPGLVDRAGWHGGALLSVGHAWGHVAV
jgi:hypothetical protein